MKTHRKYYAKEWRCGRGTVWVETGWNCVIVRAYTTATGRDTAIEDYMAPNHCPTAMMESVRASDNDVRRVLRWRQSYELGHFPIVVLDHYGEVELP